MTCLVDAYQTLRMLVTGAIRELIKLSSKKFQATIIHGERKADVRKVLSLAQSVPIMTYTITDCRTNRQEKHGVGCMSIEMQG